MAQLTDQEMRDLVLRHSPREVAVAMRTRLQFIWNNGTTDTWRRVQAGGPAATEQERYEGVLQEVRRILNPLMPDRENTAREVWRLVPWPVRAQSGLATADFGPIPTFERVHGLACLTCGGTGMTGFISGHRCVACGGDG